MSSTALSRTPCGSMGTVRSSGRSGTASLPTEIGHSDLSGTFQIYGYRSVGTRPGGGRADCQAHPRSTGAVKRSVPEVLGDQSGHRHYERPSSPADCCASDAPTTSPRLGCWASRTWQTPRTKTTPSPTPDPPGTGSDRRGCHTQGLRPLTPG